MHALDASLTHAALRLGPLVLRGGERAAAGDGVGQALIDQYPDRLADGPDRQPCLAGQVCDRRQRFPWPDLTGLDAGTQDRGELLVAGFRRVRVDLHLVKLADQVSQTQSDYA
jgi:hypothetical protein